MRYKTERYLQVFKESAERYISMLGMTEWKVYFFNEEWDYNSYASIRYDIPGYVASFNLEKYWDEKPTPEQVSSSAFHEACELLFAKINILSKRRFLSEIEIDDAIHRLCRTFEKTIYPLLKVKENENDKTKT